jgi:O-antigen/teichoic acid export membrane protein
MGGVLTDKDLSGMIKESARGSLVLMIGEISSILISALGYILVARFLGATDYGLVSIAQLPVSFGLIFLNNGFSRALIRYLAQRRADGDRQDLRNLMVAGALIHLIIGFVVFLIIFFLAGTLADHYFHNPGLIAPIRVLSFTVLTQSILVSVNSVFIGFETMKYRVSVSFVSAVLRSFLGPGLILMGFGIMGAVLGQTVPSLIASLIGLLIFSWFLRSEVTNEFSISVSAAFRLIISYGYTLFFAEILRSILDQFLNFLLPIYVETSILGNYRAATTFSAMLGLFLVPVTTSMFPLFSKFRSGDDSLGFVFGNMVKYLSLIVLPIIAFVMASADNLVLVLLESTYELSPFFMRVFFLQFILIVVGWTSLDVLLQSQNAMHISFRGIVLRIFIGLPLGLLMIPRYGVLGLLGSQLAQISAEVFYKLWWVKRSFGLSPDWGKSLRLLVSAIICFVVSWFSIYNLHINPWLEIVVGGVVLFASYLFSILFLRGLTIVELNEIRSLFVIFGPLRPVLVFLVDLYIRIGAKFRLLD